MDLLILMFTLLYQNVMNMNHNMINIGLSLYKNINMKLIYIKSTMNQRIQHYQKHFEKRTGRKNYTLSLSLCFKLDDKTYLNTRTIYEINNESNQKPERKIHLKKRMI